MTSHSVGNESRGTGEGLRSADLVSPRTSHRGDLGAQFGDARAGAAAGGERHHRVPVWARNDGQQSNWSKVRSSIVRCNSLMGQGGGCLVRERLCDTDGNAVLFVLDGTRWGELGTGWLSCKPQSAEQIDPHATESAPSPIPSLGSTPLGSLSRPLLPLSDSSSDLEVGAVPKHACMMIASRRERATRALRMSGSTQIV